MIYRIVVDGDAVPQGRPRFSRNGHVFDPAKSREYKEYIKLHASQNSPECPVTGPVKLSLMIYRAIPKSFSRKKRDDAISGIILPTTKPDFSNVLKGVEDALKGIWYADDSQIVSYGDMFKVYSDKPRIEVEMEEI
jgi:Holliday junction resolvase RusA-like endonuclease